MRFRLSLLFLFIFFNLVVYGQGRAELEERRKKTLEEINYVDNLLKTTSKEKSEGMNACQDNRTKAGSERICYKKNER